MIDTITECVEIESSSIVQDILDNLSSSETAQVCTIISFKVFEDTFCDTSLVNTTRILDEWIEEYAWE
jgi:hypothetical protein